MNTITEFKGYKVGDKIAVKFPSGYVETGCEILEIRRTSEGRVRVNVSPRRGVKMEVDSDCIEEGCHCLMKVLMSSGCKCGGR
jgi:hypothetical protein